VVQRLTERGKLGGGVAHHGSTLVREGWRQWLIERLRSVGVLSDLPREKEGGW
jgi:hypothetical protein